MSESIVLFHGTTDWRAENILNNGFVPDERGIFYLTNHRPWAVNFGQARAEADECLPGNTSVVRIECPRAITGIESGSPTVLTMRGDSLHLLRIVGIEKP
jgi:hypothetical protein